MARFRFAADKVHIASKRSAAAQRDTLWVSTTLRVTNAHGAVHRNWGTKGYLVGDVDTGDDFRLNLVWDDVDVEDSGTGDGGAIWWVVLMANHGKRDDGFQDVLNKAGEAFLDALIDKTVEMALAQGVGVATLAYIAGTFAIAAAQKAVEMLTANCDGQVVSTEFEITGAQLAGRVPLDWERGGEIFWTKADDNPGLQSPAGCGDNSHYFVNYSIRRPTAQVPARAPVSLVPVPVTPETGTLSAVVVAADGSIQATAVLNHEPWREVSTLTSPRKAVPGAAIAFAEQPAVRHQLDALFADEHGAIHILYGNEFTGWTGPHEIAPAGTTVPGAAIALAQQGTRDQLTAVFSGPADGPLAGTLQVMWVEGTGTWQGPIRIPTANDAKLVPGAPIALSRQGLRNQLTAMFVDTNGAIQVAWVEDAASGNRKYS